MNAINKLEPVTLPAGVKVRQPEPEVLLSTNCPAMEILTDFEHSVPPMLEASTSVNNADQLMHREHCTMKLVIGQDEVFKGIVTYLDIHSSKLMQVATKTGISRNDLTVADVMIPRTQLHAVSFAKFEKATVGDVLALLESLDERYLLVMDYEAGVLRGVVSLRDLRRRLHLPETAAVRANSFADLQAALAS